MFTKGQKVVSIVSGPGWSVGKVVTIQKVVDGVATIEETGLEYDIFAGDEMIQQSQDIESHIVPLVV